MRRIAFILFWLHAAAAPAADRLVLVDAPPRTADLVAADRWQWAFATEGRKETVSAASCVCWGTFVEPRSRRILVCLADGGLLTADGLQLENGKLTTSTGLLGEIVLPTEQLAGIVLQPPADAAERDALIDRLAGDRTSSEQVLLVNGDEVPGSIQRLSREGLRINTKLGETSVEFASIRAVAFNATRKPPVPSGLHALVGLSDGTRIDATGLSVNEKAVQIQWAGGATWTAAPGDVRALLPLGGQVAYLSDISPAEYRHVPYLDLQWPFGRDRTCAGRWLRAGGRLYPKGIGMHSTARLSYDLPPCSRFEAELAIDDSASPRGSVVFRVYADDQEQPRYSSPPVRGGQPPLPISVDVRGVKRLHLVVVFGERADELDRADWLAARVVKML